MRILQALLHPDRIFYNPALQERLARPLLVPALLLTLFLPYCVGQRLVAGYYQNPFVTQLAALEVDARLNAVMFGAPPEAREHAREQMVGSLLGGQGQVFRSISILLASLFFLFMVIEAWMLHGILSQFFGGQEERLPGGRRPSLLLFLIGFVPLALRKLLEGAIMAFRDPEAAANALTLEEYRRLSRLSFSLLDRLDLSGVPPVLLALLRAASDPFVLWTVLLLVLGAKAVYRVSLRSALVMGLAVVALIVVQSALLARLGIRLEI